MATGEASSWAQLAPMEASKRRSQPARQTRRLLALSHHHQQQQQQQQQQQPDKDDDFCRRTQNKLTPPKLPSKSHHQNHHQNQNQRHHHRHQRQHQQSREMCTPSFAPGAMLFCLLVSCVIGGVWCSPPVDYFIFTSQLASAQPETQNISTILPSLQSIYAPNKTNSDKQQQQQQQVADELARRVLRLIGNSSHTHDNDQTDLEATRYAWSLMERQATVYMRNRLHSVELFLAELLQEAQVSEGCRAALQHTLGELAHLRQWATLMWNSWGDFPPAGIFAGSFTDLGSYRGCMRVDEHLTERDQQVVGSAQYCMLDFQPLVPTRPRFHSIFKRVLGHSRGHLTGGDFSQLGSPVSSRHTAHGVASSRYSQLFGSNNNNNNNNINQAEEDLSNVEPSVASILATNNKYNKRTIVHNSTGGSSQQQQQAGHLQQPPTANDNLTLTAEALIELAQKAQYFYYVKFRLGACLPTKCTNDDVKRLARVGGQRAILQSSQVNCMQKEQFKLNNYQLVAIWILSILASIAVLGTVVDLLGFKENVNRNTLANWLLPFSTLTNAKRLFDLDTAGTHGDLECIHGLRFFSMVWVIYGHTILYMEYQSFTHFYDVIETQIPSFLLLPSLNANFSVDTFFVISGILTTYVTWEYTKGDPRKFNKFAFTISRYIRLTPQLAIVILCFFLLPLFGDGPMYKQVADKQAQLCYNNWHINLLYLQTYSSSEQICIDPSWWLSIEMTFHLVSMLVIIVMIQNVRRGMWLNFFVAAGLTIWGASIHYTNGFAIQYLPSIPQRYEVSAEQTKMFFHRPYPHAASYFIGIALGYVLANRTIKKLTRWQIIQGWSICAFGLIVSLWGSYYWNLGAPYTQLQATIYYNVCQILWPTSIAWIILACSLGHGGFVDSILSARAFVPLGRITYMTYLSHALIIYYHSASMNIPMEPSMLLFTYLFIANTSLALLLGVVLTIVYESPILNLQKTLFTYLTRKFDPTLKDGHNLVPTTTTATIIMDNPPEKTFEMSNQNQITVTTTLLAEEEDNNKITAIPMANGTSDSSALANNNHTAVANCLILDSQNNKQINRNQQQHSNGASK